MIIKTYQKASEFPSQPNPTKKMALLIQAFLAVVFFFMASNTSLSFPWSSFPSDKLSAGWNTVYEDMLLNSGESTASRSRRKIDFLGVPCGLCGQLVLGREALSSHYNYHFLQSELACFGSGSSQASTSRQPSFRSNYFHGQASTSRQPAAMQSHRHTQLYSPNFPVSVGQQSLLLEQQQPQMMLNNHLVQPPTLRSYSAARLQQQNHPAAAIDMANQLPLHPLLAQPPRTTATNTNYQLELQRRVNQVQCSNGNGRPADGRQAANQQPPQDVIDVKDDENDCSSDGSEILDLTLSL